MRITKWGEYGILCTSYLAGKFQAGSSASAAEISEAHNIPLQYTQQILHRLRKGGVIQSLRGPHGGFRLTKSPTETTLKDILYAAEGKTFEIICESHPLTPGVCDTEVDCGLKAIWQDLRQTIDLALEQKTLASISTLTGLTREKLVHLAGRQNRSENAAT